MSQGIATSLPTVNAASSTVKPLPTIINTGYMVPDEVFSFLDITDPKLTTSSKVKEKINNVLDYFWEKRQGGDLGEVLYDIQQEFQKFGQPRLGSNRLEQLYHFVTIQRQINQLEKKKKALTNG